MLITNPVWLFLCSAVLSCTYMLVHGFVDVLDLQQDNTTMHRGSNLMYLTLGSEEHNIKVAQSIVASFNIQHYGCHDAHKHSMISDHVHRSHAHDHPKLVVVHGLECLSQSERRALDFAYRLTDSSSDASHVIVLFSMKAAPSKGSGNAVSTTSAHDLKLKVAEALNEDSVFFNGHAFTGRLTRTFFESDDVEVVLPAPGCAALKREDMCSHLARAVADSRLHNAVDVPTQHNNFSEYYLYAVIVLIVVVVLVSVLFRKSSTTNDENTNTYTQHTVSATVHTSTPMNYTNPYTSTNTYSSNATTDTYGSYSYADSTTSATTHNTAYSGYNSTYSTPEDSPKRKDGVTRRSLTRLQMKQLAKRDSPTTIPDSNANTNPSYNAHTTSSHTAHTSNPTNSSKDRRSTGSISTQARHKPTSSGPAGEETVIWTSPDSNVHDTRSKKHTRSSARF